MDDTFRLMAKAYKLLTYEEGRVEAEFKDTYDPEDKAALTALSQKLLEVGNDLKTLAFRVKAKAESAHGGEAQIDNEA